MGRHRAGASPLVRNALRAQRAVHGWSQGELAERLGVSRQTVNAIENGRYDPSLPLAFTISAVLGRPIDALFFPDEDVTEASI